MNKTNKNESIERKKVKVIHVLQSAGGVAEYIKDLLKNFDKENYENVIIASNDYIHQKEVKRNCDEIFYVDMVREINIKKDFKAILKIRKIVKKEKPDILYLHSSKAGALGRIAFLFNKRIKIIYNAHGWYFNADIGKKKIIYQLIEKILAFRTNKIIAISKSEYNSALEKHICKKEKMVLIENGIDIDKYIDCNTYRSSTREKYKINEEDIVVGIVGRVSEQKDPITTIKAAEKVIKENNNIYFMFVGTGELEEEILNYAKEQKIDSNIIVTGWVDNVKQYIAAFDIALLPSKWEGFGLAILEYMVCKKPIIATKVGGIADILNTPDSAFFVEKENPNDIVNQIKKIISGNNDFYNIVEKNYKKCITRFSIKRVTKQTEDVLKDVFEAKRRKK